MILVVKITFSLYFMNRLSNQIIREHSNGLVGKTPASQARHFADLWFDPWSSNMKNFFHDLKKIFLTTSKLFKYL